MGAMWLLFCSDRTRTLMHRLTRNGMSTPHALLAIAMSREPSRTFTTHTHLFAHMPESTLSPPPASPPQLATTSAAPRNAGHGVSSTCRQMVVCSRNG